MRRLWVKWVCAILCVLSLNVGVWGSVLCLIWYDLVPENLNFYDSNFCWRVTDEYIGLVYEKVELLYGRRDGSLSVYAQVYMDELDAQLDPAVTNFRYICRDADGAAVFSNVDGEDWYRNIYEISAPRLVENYGYDENGNWRRLLDYTLEYGVVAPLTAQDGYMAAMNQMEWIHSCMPVFIAVSIACLALGVILLILLLVFAGRRVGKEEVVLTLHDRIPYDLYLAAQIFLNALCWGLALVDGLWYLSYSEDPAYILLVGAGSVGGTVLVLLFLLTTAVRIKARTMFRNTVIWRVCRWLWRGCRRLGHTAKRAVSAAGQAVRVLPLAPRAVGLFLLYLLAQLILLLILCWGIVYFYSWWSPGAAAVLLAVILTLLLQGGTLYLICRWIVQWRSIRQATGDIVAGKTDVKIETERFYPDLKEHAEHLNNLGGAIDNAVGARLKSERFKAELITNVSHDLKTPLTSIINYVDLLKKEAISNPTAVEYIEVLDRKSQRLKKLTEDLVEASKASTGALSVNRERLDASQLIRQATGEYEEKLAAAGLTLMVKLPEEPVYIHADGRHVWRVLDNLLGNCAKYALEGTRVYLDAVSRDGSAVITVKNVSRRALDIPAEQLMERFVRGDEARATEGSGLGLSIARSLVELQGGRFSLDIDGDLFKATILLPLA